MTNVQIAIALMAYALPTVAAAVLWSKLQAICHQISALRRVAEDDAAYRPDDLMDAVQGATFERASRYWSNIILRLLPPPK